MIDRREFLRRAAVTTAGLAFTGIAEISFLADRGWADVAGPGTGDTFGVSVQTIGKQTNVEALQALEAMSGRMFATVHNRFPWQTSLVNRYSTFIAGRGQVPILSWFTRGKQNVKWADIAAGVQDARIIAEATSLKAAGWPAYFCFHKEPEDETSLGNAAQWRAAHQRVWSIFQDVGVSNVRFVACFMAPTFNGSNGGPDAWLPDNYDLIGVDGYNRNIGGNWRSFEKIFTPAHQVATALGRPLFVIEHGCVEGKAGQKAQWFQDAQRVLQGWPEVVGVSYNNEGSGTGNYRVDTSASARDAFSAVATSAFFNPAQTFWSGSGPTPATTERLKRPGAAPSKGRGGRRHRHLHRRHHRQGQGHGRRHRRGGSDA
jgi:hypothetical protein